MKLPAVKPQRLSEYVAPGHSDMRDAILAAIDSVDEELQVGIALYFAVRSLDMLADCSVTPAAKRVAAGTADAVRDRIPGKIEDIMRDVKKGSGR